MIQKVFGSQLKKKKILFVSGATLKRPPYTFSGHDAHDANNHEEFIKMNNFFFNNFAINLPLSCNLSIE